jgi:hypothetical protein
LAIAHGLRPQASDLDKHLAEPLNGFGGAVESNAPYKIAIDVTINSS